MKMVTTLYPKLRERERERGGGELYE